MIGRYHAEMRTESMWASYSSRLVDVNRRTCSSSRP